MPIELVVVTPEGQAFSGTVDQVVLPGAEGDFGVLENHERFLAPLKWGAMEIKEAGGSQWSVVSDGFAEVSSGQVVVMVDSCQAASAINLAAVEAELAELKTALTDLGDSENHERRRAELLDAIAAADAKIEVCSRV